MYNADRERIRLLHALGVPLATIVEGYLKHGKYRSLKNYQATLQRQPSRNASAEGAESKGFPICLTTPHPAPRNGTAHGTPDEHPVAGH